MARKKKIEHPVVIDRTIAIPDKVNTVAEIKEMHELGYSPNEYILLKKLRRELDEERHNYRSIVSTNEQLRGQMKILEYWCGYLETQILNLADYGCAECPLKELIKEVMKFTRRRIKPDTDLEEFKTDADLELVSALMEYPHLYKTKERPVKPASLIPAGEF